MLQLDNGLGAGTCKFNSQCRQAAACDHAHQDALTPPAFPTLQVIKVQTGGGPVISAVLHTMEVDSSAEDLWARAMNERNPVHSFLFSKAGPLLTANAAGVRGLQERKPLGKCKLPEYTPSVSETLCKLPTYPTTPR